VNQNEAVTDYLPHCESYKKQPYGPSDFFGGPIYIKPKTFYANQSKMLPFKKTNQYLKDNEKFCNQSGYNGDPMCNITTTKIMTRDMLIKPGERSRSLFGFDFDLIAGYSKYNNNTSPESKYKGVQFEMKGYTLLVWVKQAFSQSWF